MGVGGGCSQGEADWEKDNYMSLRNFCRGDTGKKMQLRRKCEVWGTTENRGEIEEFRREMKFRKI